MSVDEHSLDNKNHDVEGAKPKFRVETQDVYDEEDSGIDPVYQAKARILNDALQEIGMGKYQVSMQMVFYRMARLNASHL